jgi:Protein of unknown function (DUF3224)
MNTLASGTFTVAMNAVAPSQRTGAATIERLTLTKRYSGPLDAAGDGDMLTALADTAGSGAYVAIEAIQGSLEGKTGGFVVQHAGTMGGGAEKLSITIVPDSGYGQLRGIGGSLAIEARDGRHVYTLSYTLPVP